MVLYLKILSPNVKDEIIKPRCIQSYFDLTWFYSRKSGYAHYAVKSIEKLFGLKATHTYVVYSTIEAWELLMFKKAMPNEDIQASTQDIIM